MCVEDIRNSYDFFFQAEGGIRNYDVTGVQTCALPIFNQDAWSFLTAGTILNPDTKWTAQGESKITLRELLTWPTSATEGGGVTSSRLEVIQKNLMGNVFNAVVQTTLIGFGFKFAKKILRKPIAQGNRLIKIGRAHV